MNYISNKNIWINLYRAFGTSIAINDHRIVNCKCPKRRFGNMKACNCFSALLLLLIMVSYMPQRVYAGEVKLGDKVITVRHGNVTKLCPFPGCEKGQHITRIPKGTVLKVEGVMSVRYGNSTTKWVETTYNEKRGWISIFDTDKSK